MKTLMKMTTTMKNFGKNERGATAIEYGLIAALIAVAIVGVLVTLGPKLQAVFSSVSATVQ